MCVETRHGARGRSPVRSRPGVRDFFFRETMTALSRGIALLFFLAEASSLLQVHTRLAGAILKQALHEAQREKEAYLAEADRLIAKAKE